MMVGYARVSTTDQDTRIQVEALERAGVERLFQERISAVKSRPQLELMLDSLAPGDQLVVYKVDRLARSLSHLLAILERVESSGATFRSLNEPIETGTLLGRLMLQLLGSFAEFERGVIRERCAAGTKAAMARGVRWGRPRRLDWALCTELAASGLLPGEIASRLGCHHTAVRWALKHSAPASEGLAA
jgi:DNA invertase Pin-like site-specific DNA recombinase